MIILVMGYFINITLRYLLFNLIPNTAIGIIEKDIIIIGTVVAISLVIIKIFGKRKQSTPPHTIED